MRLLVIGMPLPNQRIDNYSFFSAPSFFDYDAILVEPSAIVQAIDEVVGGGGTHATAADEPIVNAPSRGLSVGLADFLRRRRDETERLLERGGTVAVFARPSHSLPFIAGLPGADQYGWLPAPPALAYAEPYLVPGFGTQVVLTDSSSAVAPFIDGYERWFHYRAYFAEHMPTFAASGRVFARSIGGAAIGVRFSIGRGQVIFLPAMFDVPAGDPRFNLATTLLSCLTQSVHAAAEEEAPEWAASVSFPGGAPLEAALEQAAQQLEEVQQRYENAKTQLDQVVRYRRLLWQSGRYGLEPVVRDAFQLLGFSVTLDPDTPAVMDADGRTAFLEVEGAREAVVEWPYFRLQKRLEKDLLATRQPKKGVIVVNGNRLMPPSERGPSYSDALRIAAENYRYALLTSEALSELVREAQQHPEPESLKRLRDLVFETVGDTRPEGFPISREAASISDSSLSGGGSHDPVPPTDSPVPGGTESA